MSSISTHVLDTSRGEPAAALAVTLDRHVAPDSWSRVGSGVTDADGRIKSLLAPGERLEAATYRLRFDTAAYHATRGVKSFYPWVDVVFAVADSARHTHVPLLLSPFGYSTYRGT